MIYHVSDISSDGLFTIVYDSDPELIGPSGGTVIAGDGLSKSGDMLSVDIPVRDLTEDQYNALPEAEKSKGLIFLPDDEGGGSSSGEVYSTEEIRIGTWIDGKPLYRKVITNLTSGAVGNGNINFISKVPDNMATMVYIRGLITIDGYIWSIPTSGMDIGVQNNNIITVLRFNTWTNCPIIVTIEYTKTAD